MNAHIPVGALGRYAAGDPGMAPDVLWAVETHLEQCADCRSRLADASDGDTMALLAAVWVKVDAAMSAAEPATVRRRWMPARSARWVTPVFVPWLVTTVLVVLVALGFDLAVAGRAAAPPSLVVLLAPVAPLLGVATAWTRRLDPAHELVVATARAGLGMVLRRTLVVLVVVIPVLAVAGWLVGASPARWLMPCLAFTACALALGKVVGLPRAAWGLALLWATVAVGPSIVTARLPVLLTEAALPGWAALTVVVALVLLPRRSRYAELR
ncbi:zf-HC2 domain-containing protein [Verrucosispora sp. WMMD573]|uniref:zf-HC2 domain-containing protein n=1 Tax=Verrucosispora sp. WMMD573 TaxID=3015149 RepID=UPI00248BA1FC|nr:zf-HC2 domain-containing protein [Verrucosispora sp. WMMD573]WBB55619.1 zf-HC2 domain-containing protein [Verrucosispora sp. WMMD573]